MFSFLDQLNNAQCDVEKLARRWWQYISSIVEPELAWAAEYALHVAAPLLAGLPALAGPARAATRAGARHIGYPCYPAYEIIKAESGNCGCLSGLQ
ncbi:MAG: hypothetical protein ACYDHX_16815 [Methanothrix sp.]